ncbi:MAG: PAS domain S-box protein, partial [Pseudomonadota bacterium]
MSLALSTPPEIDTLDPASCFEVISRHNLIARFDLDGILLSANPLFLSVFGYEACDALGQHHSMFLVDPNRHDPSYDRMWSDFADGVARKGEVLRRSRAGDVIWLQAVYCPVFDDE